MFNRRRKFFSYLLLVCLSFTTTVSYGLKFEPGIGLGLESTDNARLTVENQVDDLIVASYVGARLSENDGSINYDATAAFNRNNYLQDSFANQRYFNLAANAGWEMIKERFSWTLSDYYSQLPVDSNNSNTPDNLQDSNAFTLGANINLPISQRQSFVLVPMFNQYYYETQRTDNKQYTLSASWNYQLFRLTNVGLTASTRTIDYFEQSLSNTRFTNLAVVISGQRKLSTFSVNAGSTTVKRDSGEETTGFSGNMNWSADLTARSKFKTLLSTELTDTSSVAAGNNFSGVNGNDVQLTTDVVRNSVFNLSYLRDDAPLNTRAWLEYRKLTYSDNPLDRVVRSLGLSFNYPITRLLSSGFYVKHNRTKQLDTQRLDKRYSVGGNLKYNFSRKLRALLDVKYRKKESTTSVENYDETSVFVSLVYGFGQVSRPTRGGGN